MRALGSLLALAAVACSDAPRTPADPAPVRPAPTGVPAAREVPDLPPELEGDPGPHEVTAPLPSPPASDRTVAAAVPARGCVPLSAAPVRLWPAAGPPAVVAHGSGFLAAAYVRAESGTEQLVVLFFAADAPPRPLATHALSPAARGERHAPPAIASLDPTRALVAITDGAGVLFAAEIATTPGAPLSFHRIAGGADLRFPPALAVLEHARLLAWTEGSTPMRVRLAYLRPGGRAAEEIRDLTPPSASAAAPAFAVGGAPALHFVDAHAGLSNVHRVRLADDGTPSPAEIARVVSNLPDVPQIAVARRASDGATHLGYVAMGRFATTAVGLLPLAAGNTEDPQPIVPGTAYVPLQVSAAAGPAAVVFAASQPQSAGGRPPRELAIRVLDAAGLGPVLALRDTPEGDAAHPSIARGRDGTYAVAFTSGTGIHAAYLRCADR